MQRYAVIPTRDRPEKYRLCVRSIAPQVDEVVTVAHHSPPYVGEVGRTVVPYDEEPPNISRMWRLGLDACARLAHEAEGDDAQWLVAILNDDVQVEPSWFDLIEEAMLRDRTVLGCGAGPAGHSMITGWAFVLRGNTIRPDESWGWWGSDNHIHEQAMTYWGGWSRVPRARAYHDRTDLQPGDLLTSARRDLDRWQRSHPAQPLGAAAPEIRFSGYTEQPPTWETAR